MWQALRAQLSCVGRGIGPAVVILGVGLVIIGLAEGGSLPWALAAVLVLGAVAWRRFRS